MSDRPNQRCQLPRCETEFEHRFAEHEHEHDCVTQRFVAGSARPMKLAIGKT
jgi:hypothetical protein